MSKKPIKILAINPGTRYMGVAVFEGSELLNWRMKAVKGKWSKKKLEKIIGIISLLIDYSQPDVIVLKRLHPSRTSQNLSQLVDEIAQLARRRHLKLCRYSLHQVESFYYPRGQINKQRLAELVTSNYPVLSCELEKEKKHRNLYYLRMFEAVALGSMCFHQLDRQNHE